MTVITRERMLARFPGELSGPQSDPDAPRWARALGLVYEDLPPWFTTWSLRDLLGLRSPNSIERAARQGRIVGAYRVTLRPVHPGLPPPRGYWRIPKDAALRWAYERKRGPQPEEGIQHLRE